MKKDRISTKNPQNLYIKVINWVKYVFDPQARRDPVLGGETLFGKKFPVVGH